MNRKKILVLVDHYLPGYKSGGPVRSIANIISHLNPEFDFSVIASNTDLHETKPYDEVKSDEWNDLADGSKVFYVSKQNESYSVIKKLLTTTPFDILYINSIYSVYYGLIPMVIQKLNRINCKIIIAPRGILGAGSLKLKATKKKIFLFVVKVTGFYNNVKWHASTEREKNEIQNTFGTNAKITVAINLTAKREIVKIPRIKIPGELRLAFLSRIAKIKNLDAVANYLSKIKKNAKVILDIYGPVYEPLYWEFCQGLFKQLPSNISVNYNGPVAPEEIVTVLSKSHFAILPTFNENYGHTIVESFVSGCPPIISDHTPWRNLSSSKAGWDISLNNENEFVNTLNTCVDMNQTEYDAWSHGAYSFAEKIVNNMDAIDQSRKLFNEAVK